MSKAKSITHAEVRALAKEWFHGVAVNEQASSIARLFRYPDIRIHAPDGRAFSLEEHRQLHERWVDEFHQFGDFELTTLCDQPHRVQAVGEVYWEARYLESSGPASRLIKAVAGEDWIIERRADGTLCFVLYWTKYFRLLPDSAPILL